MFIWLSPNQKRISVQLPADTKEFQARTSAPCAVRGLFGLPDISRFSCSTINTCKLPSIMRRSIMSRLAYRHDLGIGLSFGGISPGLRPGLDVNFLLHSGRYL